MNKIVKSRLNLCLLKSFFVVTTATLVIFTGFAVASLKRPMVAISSIKSLDSRYSYVGPAMTQMLETRLASEGIDTFSLSGEGIDSDAAKLSDFIVTGQVIREDNAFDVKIYLKDPGTGEILKAWQLKAVSLEVLAQDVGLFSVKLADTIKNAEDILKNRPESSRAGNSGQTDMVSDEFLMARMHPDKLVREQLEKDQEKEREQEKERRLELKKEQKQRQQRTESAEEWASPVYDVYDPESDDIPNPQAEQEANSSLSLNPEPIAQDMSGEDSKETSWYSFLWPFGQDHDQEQEGWEKEKKKLDEERAAGQEAPKVVQENRLPYPPPPHEDFHIPSPVPVNEAVAKAEKMYAQQPVKPKEEGWFSWLWPWGNEEETVSATPEQGHGNGYMQAKVQPDSTVGQGIDNMINSLSVQKEASGEAEKAVPETADKESEVKQGMDHMIQSMTATPEGNNQEADVSGTEPAETETFQRQEHVYFGPRLNQEEPGKTEQETASAMPEEPAGQNRNAVAEHDNTEVNQAQIDIESEAEQDVQARVLEDLESNGHNPAQPESVQLGSLRETPPEADSYAASTAAVDSVATSPPEGKEERLINNEQPSNQDAESPSPSGDSGPIWRWY